jgi:hypothetical protein
MYFLSLVLILTRTLRQFSSYLRNSEQLTRNYSIHAIHVVSTTLISSIVMLKHPILHDGRNTSHGNRRHMNNIIPKPCPKIEHVYMLLGTPDIQLPISVKSDKTWLLNQGQLTACVTVIFPDEKSTCVNFIDLI